MMKMMMIFLCSLSLCRTVTHINPDNVNFDARQHAMHAERAIVLPIRSGSSF